MCEITSSCADRRSPSERVEIPDEGPEDQQRNRDQEQADDEQHAAPTDAPVRPLQLGSVLLVLDGLHVSSVARERERPCG
jgi:hypothetical protein